MIWQGTAFAKFKKDRCQQGKWKKYIDGVDPGGAFLRVEGPPFLSYLRVGAMSTNGCEQEGRDQRDAQDMEKGHPGARKQGTETGSLGLTLFITGAFVA